jgi:hypothetical protein
MDWFNILALAVVVWFVLLFTLFYLLEKNHPDVYKSIGSPSLFANPRIAWRFLRFLMAGHWRSLPDPKVQFLCTLMWAFFVVYTVFFVAYFVSTFSRPQQIP